MKTLIKQLIFIIMRSSILVGGQAVINGVMMRVPGFYATAVRDNNNVIIIDRHIHQSLVEKHNISQIPILRGFLHLVDSMKIAFLDKYFSR